MTEEALDDVQSSPELAFGPGDKLRQAREAKGLSLDQVAAETRIPMKQLELIEAGAFGEMPGRTYALGFSRTYAKLVDLDEKKIAADVREELAMHEDAQPTRSATFEPGDPARVPSRGLVWLSLAAVVLLVVGGFAFYRSFFSPAVDLPPQVAETSDQGDIAADGAAVAAADAPNAQGPVVFTAEGEAWVRFYDAEGRVLQETILDEGDSYTVPQDADGPMLITGRPDLLEITIGGTEVPKISEELETVTDVPVSAEALIAREAEPAAQEQPETPDAG